MAKVVYTDTDIEEQARLGIKSIHLDENAILTDVAYEKAKLLNIEIVRNGPNTPPNAPVRPYLNDPVLRRVPAVPAPVKIKTIQAPGRDILHYPADVSEEHLRAAIIRTGQILYDSGLMISNDGNISARMADGNILMTPAGVGKGRIQPVDLLVINIDGKLLRGAADPTLKPSSEQPMHLEVYRQRPDIRAVIHTHLIYANVLAISQGKVRMDVIPEAAIAFGEIPITDFSMPSSPQNAEAIRTLIKDHDVMLIRNHGSLTIGKTLDEALINLERLEHVSKTLTYAELLGDVNALPPDMLEAIAKIVEQSKKKKESR